MGKSTCSFEGCDKNTMGLGLCSGHYHQQRKGKPLAPIKPKQTTEQRFWAKVKQAGDCWEWTGAATPKGYGNFRNGDAKTVGPHRWAYEALRAPIPPGLEIDHLCQNTLCVNPWHLEPVPTEVNNQRKPLQVTRLQVVCSEGHALDRENTYVQQSTGYRYCRICSRRRQSEYAARKRVA